MSEWGNPSRSVGIFPAEFIGGVKPTRGSETSQYPEEEESEAIPSVVASERGRAQTGAVSSPSALQGRCCRIRAEDRSGSSESYKSR